jgi:hypothetical protein
VDHREFPVNAQGGAAMAKFGFVKEESDTHFQIEIAASFAPMLAELIIRSDFSPEYVLDRIQHGYDWKQKYRLHGRYFILK